MSAELPSARRKRVGIRGWIAGVISLAALLQAGPTHAQPPAAAAKSLNMVRLDAAPTIDGRLDEPMWSRATVVDDFHQVQPNEFAEPTERTRVFIFYDDDAIYVGAELGDSDPDNVTANILRQGELIQDEDEFVVILDPFNDRRSGYRFETNPNGIRNDAIYQNGTQTQWDWDGIWRAAASRTEQGWVAEMAIPFKTLSFDPADDTWGINFSRNVARTGERMGWVSRNRNQNASITGRAVGMNGMQQGVGLDIVPSVTLRETKSYAPSGGESDVEPSLDVFYKITPGLNASLTVNTDFSATEVDDRQVNLTRFGLFFPEKRDFFLKDADIFEFGRITSADGAFSEPTLENGRPFFSRSIGLSPLGEPVDLQYGGKLSGRVGRWNIGTLAIRQDEYSGVDAADIFVGRAAMNVLDESSVGMIVTSGDPRSSVDNDVLGVDFRYQNTRLRGGRQIQAEAWYQQSDTEGLDGDDGAFGLRARLPNNTGWRGGIGVKQLDRNFNPALGFIDRRGVRDNTVELGYTFRPNHEYLASIFSGLDAQRVDLLDGTLQSQVLRTRLIQLETLASDIFTLTYQANKEALFEPFEIADGIVIPDGGYSFDRYGFEVESGAHRKLSGALEFRGGDFFGGERTDVEVELAWKPSRHFRASLGYEVAEIDLPQGEFDARLARLGFDVVISATLSWVNLIQYDNLSENVGINSRVHWIPQAGREAFLVLNHNLEDLDRNDSFHSTVADVSIKLSYTLRF